MTDTEGNDSTDDALEPKPVTPPPIDESEVAPSATRVVADDDPES
jgi:hypothetical protein